MSEVNTGRRRFLIATGAVGVGLTVGSWWFYRKRNLLIAPDGLKAGENEAIFNAWIKIDSDGHIIVQVPRQEMGQGVATALPMLVAEELNVDFSDVKFEQAPIDSVYGNAVMFGEGAPYRPDDVSWLAEFTRLTQFKLGRVLGLQGTGGSSSVRDAWEPMRYAGATARAMLLTAGAQRLGVAASDCTVANGKVQHLQTNRSIGFGQLANDAAALPMPSDVKLKDRRDFKILGTPQARIDIPEKVDGSAIFGLDARPNGLVYAAIRHNPIVKGGIVKIDSSEANAMPGVLAVIELPKTSATDAAVAVVARHYWQAKKALAKVNVQWSDGPNPDHDTDAQRARFSEQLKLEDGRVYDTAGDTKHAFQQATKTLNAEYFAPYLAHATMEPINCTAVIHADNQAEVWIGNQAPTLVRMMFSRATGLESESITVHTPYLGGGFGRRSEMDVVVQAGQIAKQMLGTPVQLIWSREEDIQHDTYRPMAAATMGAALDSSGNLVGLQSKITGQSCAYNIFSRLLPGMESNLMKDRTLAEGLFDLPYQIPNRLVTHVLADEPAAVGFWRSVGYSHHAFFAEAFIDECAEAAGQDPYLFRHTLLAHLPRHQKVLQTVATKAGWGTPLPAGIGRGIALTESFGSIVAQIAEVEIKNGKPLVRRVTCAIDCGFAVNPDSVVAQMESGIIFGLSAALYGEITIKNGRIQQSNFTDYQMVKMADSPEIDVVLIESGIENLGGVGEPGTPPIAPAVANALYTISGKRIRELPIRM